MKTSTAARIMIAVFRLHRRSPRAADVLVRVLRPVMPQPFRVNIGGHELGMRRR